MVEPVVDPAQTVASIQDQLTNRHYLVLVPAARSRRCTERSEDNHQSSHKVLPGRNLDGISVLDHHPCLTSQRCIKHPHLVDLVRLARNLLLLAVRPLALARSLLDLESRSLAVGSPSEVLRLLERARNCSFPPFLLPTLTRISWRERHAGKP